MRPTFQKMGELRILKTLGKLDRKNGIIKILERGRRFFERFSSEIIRSKSYVEEHLSSAPPPSLSSEALVASSSITTRPLTQFVCDCASPPNARPVKVTAVPSRVPGWCTRKKSSLIQLLFFFPPLPRLSSPTWQITWTREGEEYLVRFVVSPGNVITS